MDHAPCTDTMAVVHAGLIALNSLSLIVLAWLAQKRRVSDRERRALAGQIRYRLLYDDAERKASIDDLNGGDGTRR